MGRKVRKDYHILAQKRKFKWIGQFPQNVRTKTLWECIEGHRWEATYDKINQGRGCPYCAGTAPKVIKDYHDLAGSREFKWLGKELPKTNRIKTPWRCPEGHEWEARYSNIDQGRGCPICSARSRIAKRRNQSSDYHAIAQKYGFKWLGPDPKSVHSKTWWECSRGHRWEGHYSNIYQGADCPYCANRIPKIAEDYRALAKTRNFKWVDSKIPKDTSGKTWWECDKGHEWQSSYGNILQGSGCPYCAGNAPKAPEEYHALAQKRGFRWLGPEVSNIAAKTQWECSEGHWWESRYTCIQRGSGCPQCADIVNGHRISAPQRKLCEMLDGILNYPCDSYRIDVALPNKRIAIEYDSWFWHGPDDENDARRDEKLIDSGWKILHVKSNSQLPKRDVLEMAIMQLEAGRKKTEIILDDWEDGPTFANLE